VVNRFQKVAGFDRAVALASSALTALIPLTIVTSAVLSKVGVKDAADRIIDRYDLTADGAQAVRDAFSPPEGTSTSVGIIGALFLLIAVLSFTRAAQRLFEQTWELKPLSVRNSVNGLLWVAVLALYSAVTGAIHGWVDAGRFDFVAAVIIVPLTFGFLVWTGSVLSAKRIPRADLVPFAVVAAVLLAIYSMGATVYVPHLFSTYANRYGVIGAVFAIISTLFCIMVVLVGSASVGREVTDELGRIRRGERPHDNEVRRQWDAVIAEARLRWATLREEIERRRRRRKEPDSAEPDSAEPSG
jgi:membrane protein